MHQDRHEAIVPDATPTNSLNQYAASYAAQGQYTPPSAEIPDEYWQQAARAQVASRSSGTSTVVCWAFVLLGLFLPILALGGALCACFMAREDSRFVPPTAVGFGIFAVAFLI